MHYKKLFPGKYLKGTDLADGDVTLTIASYHREAMENGGKVKTVLRFIEEARGLVCNSTNGDIIAGLYGEEVEGWIGKQITLWFDPSVMMGNERKGGIKVRSVKPGASARRASPLQDALMNAILEYVNGDMLGVEPTLQQFAGVATTDGLDDDTCLEIIAKIRQAIKALKARAGVPA